MHVIYTTPGIYRQQLSAITSSYMDLFVRWKVEAKHGNYIYIMFTFGAYERSLLDLWTVAT